MTGQDFIFIYSREVSNLLREQGEQYILKARSLKSDEIFTLYPRSVELEEKIKEIKQNLTIRKGVQ